MQSRRQDRLQGSIVAQLWLSLVNIAKIGKQMRRRDGGQDSLQNRPTTAAIRQQVGKMSPQADNPMVMRLLDPPLDRPSSVICI